MTGLRLGDNKTASPSSAEPIGPAIEIVTFLLRLLWRHPSSVAAFFQGSGFLSVTVPFAQLFWLRLFSG